MKTERKKGLGEEGERKEQMAKGRTVIGCCRAPKGVVTERRHTSALWVAPVLGFIYQGYRGPEWSWSRRKSLNAPVKALSCPCLALRGFIELN